MNNLGYKILGCLLLIGVAFGGGFYTGKGQKQVEIQEHVVHEKGDTKTVIKDRIVTVTRTVKPDGTVTETTKTEDKDKTQEVKTSVTEKDTDTTIKPVLSTYSLGLAAAKRWDGDLLEKPDFGVTAGYRVLGEVWVKGTVIPAQKTGLLGIEFQF